MLAAAGNQLTQEDDLLANLFYRYIKVFDAVKAIAQFVQLVIVGGKQRFCFCVGWLCRYSAIDQAMEIPS
jgi:hypothetical protein